MEKYYYRVNKLGIVQKCEFHIEKRIVSNQCLLCENNEGYDNIDGWVLCHCYSNMLENKILYKKCKELEDNNKVLRDAYNYSIKTQINLEEQIELLKGGK